MFNLDDRLVKFWAETQPGEQLIKAIRSSDAFFPIFPSKFCLLGRNQGTEYNRILENGQISGINAGRSVEA